MKKDFRGALNNTLQAETNNIQTRFERADTALARGLNNEKEQLDAEESGQPEETEALIEEKVQRESFSMPISDFEKLEAVLKKTMRLEVKTSKSELIRAGISLLDSLSDEELSTLINALPKVKKKHTV
jgi:negative regulator of genetic competence, sporulation and motility